MAEEKQKPDPRKTYEDELARQRTSLVTQLKQIQEFSVDDSAKLLAAHTIELQVEVQEAIREAQQLASELLPLVPETTSRSILAEMQDCISQFATNLQQLRTPAQAGSTNATQQYNDALARIRQAWLDASVRTPNDGRVPPVAARLRSILSYATVHGIRVKGIPEVAAEFGTQLESARKNGAAIEEILKKVEDGPQRQHLASFAKHFQGAATMHKREAWLAFGGAIALGLGGIYFASKQLTGEAFREAAASMPAAVDGIAPVLMWLGVRLFILSLLTTGFVVLLRLFRTNRHLDVLNSHRANVLSTYQLLLADASPEIKTMMLQQAASTIFNAGSTGFLGDSDFRLDQEAMDIMREAVLRKSAPAGG